VGDSQPIPVDVRIISATNKDLGQLVQKGLFRDDLFFRINVIPITLPPLRDRLEDISLLADAFFKRTRLKSGKEIQGIGNEAMAFLMAYHWPGNVRELRSAMEYAFVTCQEALIQPYHLPPTIYRDQNGSRAMGRTAAPNPKEIKKRKLMDALRRSGGNQSEAARILGVSRVTVWKQIREFGIAFRRRVDLSGKAF
jgi:two-component system response regulator HydG